MKQHLKKYKNLLEQIKQNHRVNFKRDKERCHKLLSELEKDFGKKILEEIGNNINSANRFSKFVFSKIEEYSMFNYKKYISIGKHSHIHWLQRGFNLQEAKLIKSNHKVVKKDYYSPFNYKHWMKKGFSLVEAKYKANSIRPIRPEYWQEKGLSLEESIIKAKETKDKNNRNNKSSEVNLSNTSLAYWTIKKGYSETEAKEKLKDRQNTFTLEKCIERYGEKEGVERFNKRQEKWQTTLSNLPDEEKERINFHKNGYLNKFQNIDEYFSYIQSKGKLKGFKNVKLFYESFVDSYKENIFNYSFYSPEEFYNRQNYYYKELIDFNSFVRDTIAFYDKKEYVSTGVGIIHKTTHGLLRSWNEIKFYYKLIKITQDFIIEKNYENSTLRSDFYITKLDEHIEIAGMMEIPEYREKMKFKREKYNSVILEYKDFDKYLGGLACRLH